MMYPASTVAVLPRPAMQWTATRPPLATSFSTQSSTCRSVSRGTASASWQGKASCLSPRMYSLDTALWGGASGDSETSSVTPAFSRACNWSCQLTSLKFHSADSWVVWLAKTLDPVLIFADKRRIFMVTLCLNSCVA